MIRKMILLLFLASLAHGLNWHEEPDLWWAQKCHFANGNDMWVVRGRPSQECGPECFRQRNAGCTHFVWLPYEGGECFLKKNPISRENASPREDESMCGLLKSGVDGSIPGKTTRYWDCCKVSCGWHDKAQWLYGPVTSCAKDGRTSVDKNAQSGCNGGPSYSCTSNQPWAINDNLAYGFAAGHLKGKPESETCCACYELTFTNTDIRGKKMVVQVTNTGGDLGENHFDLQIPGGGVGIFNGCQPQWGAPWDGWGQRYGGVGSKWECNSLPGDLQPGCNFRFDWFQGAGNPSVDFKRVRCPNELTEKSGCRRQDDP